MRRVRDRDTTGTLRAVPTNRVLFPGYVISLTMPLAPYVSSSLQRTDPYLFRIPAFPEGEEPREAENTLGASIRSADTLIRSKIPAAVLTPLIDAIITTPFVDSLRSSQS